MTHALTRLFALSLSASAGCVLPRFDLSGAELSWFMAEANLVDGEDGRRVRSCDGSLITTVEVGVTDDDDDDRTKRFGWSCAEGYRTPAQFFTGASDVFVDLRPGNYRMSVSAADDPLLRGAEGDPLTVSEDDDIVAIGSDDATLIQWELHPVTVDVELELRGTQACTQVAATLVYADPTAMLPDLLEDDSGEPLVYRAALASRGGLTLGGVSTPCSALIEGPDLLEGVDRGTYAIEIQVDEGKICRIDLVVDGRQTPLVLDLADLPC